MMKANRGKSRLLKWSALALAAACLVGGGWWVFARDGAASRAPVAWRTEAAARTTLETAVSCTGTLAAVGTVEVGTQVSGTILSVSADYNDQVRKGQVLAVLDHSAIQATVESAQASLEKAQAELAQAEADEQRMRPLREKGFLSAKEFLGYETATRIARAGVKSADASLSKAQKDLDNAVIRSPIDGMVITRSVEAGQTVAASLSTPTLFEIARDLSRMQIEGDVDENDIGAVKLGQTARFTVAAHPDEVFQGTVSQIRLEPMVKSNVVTYTVLVDAVNRGNLLMPGMTATVDFVTARVENALTVPNAALSFKSSGTPKAEGKSVYVPGAAGELTRVAVAAGLTDGARTEVRGASTLTDGSRVVIGTAAEETAARRSGGLFSSLMPKPPQSKSTSGNAAGGPPPGP